MMNVVAEKSFRMIDLTIYYVVSSLRLRIAVFKTNLELSIGRMIILQYDTVLKYVRINLR